MGKRIEAAENKRKRRLTHSKQKTMDTIIKFGQFVRYQRQRKGMTQLELSLKVFSKPNYEYIGRLERGVAAGITFNTAERLMLALDSELEFREFENYTPDLNKRLPRF